MHRARATTSLHRTRDIVHVLCVLSLVGCSAAPSRAALPALPNLVQQRDDVVTAGAVAAADIEPLRRAGMRSIIDLRVDDETPGFDEAAAATAAGLAYANVPVHGADGLTRETVAAFDAALRDAPRPVLVHCSSSNRVGAMAALRAAWIGGATDEDALAIGRAWGLKGLEPDVRRLLETPAP